DIAEVARAAEVREVKPGEPIIVEGEMTDDLYIIRSGSMVVEKSIGGKPVFLSYVPAGTYSGEMALLERAPRYATVKAAIRSTVVKLPAEPFRKLLEAKPQVAQMLRSEMKSRQEVNSF